MDCARLDMICSLAAAQLGGERENWSKGERDALHAQSSPTERVALHHRLRRRRSKSNFIWHEMRPTFARPLSAGKLTAAAKVFGPTPRARRRAKMRRRLIAHCVVSLVRRPNPLALVEAN